MHSSRRLLAMISLIALLAVGESLILGPHSYTPLHDEANSALPFRLISALDALSGGSDWMPWMGMGTDRRATMMDPDLDTVIYALLPSWLAYGLNKLMVPLVAGTGLFLYATRRLGLPPLPAFVGACFLATNSWVYFEKFAVAGYPLMLLWMGSARTRLRWRSAIMLFGLGVLFALVSMPVYSAWIMVGLCFTPWLLERIPLRAAVITFLPVLAGYFTVEARVFVAVLLDGPYSTRQFEAPQFVWEAFSLLAYLPQRIWFPAAVIGTLILTGQYILLIRDRRLMVTTLGAAVCILFPVAWGIFIGLVSSKINFLRAGSIRIGHEAVVWIALMGSSGLAALLSHETCSRNRNRLGVAALVLALVLPVVVDKRKTLWETIHGFTIRDLFQHPDLQALKAATAGDTPYRVATPFYLGPQGHMEPTFTAAHGLESIDGHLNVYSQRFKEFWTQVISRLATLNPSRYAEFINWGHRIYLFGVPSEWGDPCPENRQDCPVRFAEAYSLPLLSLANVRYVIVNRPLRDHGLELIPSEWRDALAAHGDMRMRDKLRLRLQGEYVGQPIYIYRNTLAFERVFVVPNFRRFTTKEALLAALADSTVEDLRRAAYVLEAEVPELPEQHATETAPAASISRYGPDGMSVTVSTPTDQILVISNSYSPFWRVSIDGLPAKVFPAYHVMLGVVLPAGRHEVEIFYSPPYSWHGDRPMRPRP